MRNRETPWWVAAKLHEKPLPSIKVTPARPEKFVGLVACCGKKLAAKAPARDLYVSPLFKLSRRVVELQCETWAILSARHGLVLPEQEIEPYDESMTAMRKADRQRWGWKVRGQLKALWPEARFLVLAGEHYRLPLVGCVEFEAPLAGLGIGQQLSQLSEAVKLSWSDGEPTAGGDRRVQKDRVARDVSSGGT